MEGYQEKYLKKSVNLGKKPSPGIVIYIGSVNNVLKWFYKKALTDVVTLDVAKKIVNKLNAEILKEGKGVIGALAAIGGLLDGKDCTYELIVYRKHENYPKERQIDLESIVLMDREIKSTFNNYDYEVKRVLIIPHGFDPVLLGIRGDEPKDLIKALKILKIKEDIEGWIIFRTNQGTNAHLLPRNISELRPYRTALIKGVIDSKPKIIKGGDVLVHIKDSTGLIRVCFFKELSEVNKVARELCEGDEVVVGGSVKLWDDNMLTLHAELLEITKLRRIIVFKNPKCPVCGATLKSAGKGKGFKCFKCGFKSKNVRKIPVEQERRISIGLYLPPPRSQKHLQKPLKRYGTERICKSVMPFTKFLA